MTYSCSDFTSDVCEALALEEGDGLDLSSEGDQALAEIGRLQTAEKFARDVWAFCMACCPASGSYAIPDALRDRAKAAGLPIEPEIKF